ncbi:MAG TPA: hypothetical protein VM260_19080 [Pirellula sp.]|nr:hypothetical protein [Pirellula sp.]
MAAKRVHAVAWAAMESVLSVLFVRESQTEFAAQTAAPGAAKSIGMNILTSHRCAILVAATANLNAVHAEAVRRHWADCEIFGITNATCHPAAGNVPRVALLRCKGTQARAQHVRETRILKMEQAVTPLHQPKRSPVDLLAGKVVQEFQRQLTNQS